MSKRRVVIAKKKKEKDNGPVDMKAALEQVRRDVEAMKKKNPTCFQEMAQRCLPLQGPKQELVPDVGLVVKCLCGMTNSQTKVVCSSCYDILPIDSVVVMTGVVLSATSTDVVVIPQVDVVQRCWTTEVLKIW